MPSVAQQTRGASENNGFQLMMCGAMTLRNSLELMILVFFQNLRKWRWLPCANQSAVPGGSIKPKGTVRLDHKTFPMAASQNVSNTRVGNDARYKRSSKVRRR